MQISSLCISSSKGAKEIDKSTNFEPSDHQADREKKMMANCDKFAFVQKSRLGGKLKRKHRAHGQ
jgi:hypothetical protein